MTSSEKLWIESRRGANAGRICLHWWKNRRKASTPVRGYVWLIHGMGEHAGRYEELANFLTVLDFDVLAPDLPGYGLTRTEGGMPQAISIPDTRTEIVHVVKHWMTRGPQAANGAAQKPWFLLGHSLGALTSLEWILHGKNGFEGLEFAKRAFLSAPPLKLRVEVPLWKKAMAENLGAWLPDVRVSNEIKTEDLMRDAAGLAMFREDPLIRGDTTPRVFLSMQVVAEDVLKRPNDVELPVFLAVGSDDPLVDPSVVRDFYNRLNTEKVFLEIEGALHEILNETSRRKVYEAVAEWFL